MNDMYNVTNSTELLNTTTSAILNTVFEFYNESFDNETDDHFKRDPNDAKSVRSRACVKKSSPTKLSLCALESVPDLDCLMMQLGVTVDQPISRSILHLSFI